ncbi:ABC transporter permease [Chitinophaga eiseniae]|uniref:ABC transporter permease n=1 Tax=Chitinophaga eiseniae TaxID=634771 RepID=A0A847SKK5_9BACT|nr:ABC transporter permease [Chitinophaga eiseniae]NLR78078.1 ABC transporter permease [Chitinophaga eiseniae]
MFSFFVLLKKEIKLIRRDSKAFLLLFVLSISLVIIFGYVLRSDLHDLKIAICDENNSLHSQRLSAKIGASKLFRVINIGPSQIEASLQTDVKAVVVIPPDFTSGNKVQIICDATDPNLATTASSYLNKIISEYYNSSENEEHYTSKMLYNPTLNAGLLNIPGVISLIIMLICVMTSSVQSVKEKEFHTIETLKLTNVPKLIIYSSKLLPYFFISFIQITATLAISIILWGFPFSPENILPLIILSSIYIITCLSVGLLISVFTQNQFDAQLVSLMAMIIPTALFTGFIFPLENMPLPLQYLSTIVPSRWYYSGLLDILVRGGGIQSAWKYIFIMMLMSALLNLISIKKIKSL